MNNQQDREAARAVEPRTLTLADLEQANVFAAEAHRDQRRADATAAPYINHPLEVSMLLATIGQETSLAVLIAAKLHDTKEDTATTLLDIALRFGPEVAGIVDEVTDDKSLPKHVRKQLQIKHAPHKSREAQRVKLADKLSNCRGLLKSAPKSWDKRRQLGYQVWAYAVVDGLRGACPPLELQLDAVFAQAGVPTDASERQALLDQYMADMAQLAR